MLTLDNFDTQINPQIVQRGQAYFNEQAIECLDEDPPGTWLAVVEGTENYEIEVVLAGKNIDEVSCDCPYDGGPVCKHIIAVLFALRERAAVPKKKPGKPAKLGLEDLLLKINLEELRDFVRHQKKDSRDFGDKFMLFFAEKDPNLDVSAKYEGLVRQIVRSHSSKGFMDYRQTFAFSKEIQSILNAADTAIAQKNFRDAFTIGKVLSREALQLLKTCDDSAGNIGGVLSSGISIFEKIADAETVSPELRDQLLEYLLKSLSEKDWFDYGDSGYELLAIAEKTARRTEPGLYLNLLDTLLKIHTGGYSEYKQDYFKKAKIRFLENIGRAAEAEKLVAENMDIVEVRQAQVQTAIEKKEFSAAKQLIFEGIKIAEGKKHPGTVRQWEEMLFEISQMENDVATARHFSKKFAFDRILNLKYYQLWKATFSPAEWPEVIELHIEFVFAEEKSKPRKMAWDSLELSLFGRLSPIFIQEEMWQRLLELVPKDPDESSLSAVHPHLAKRFPKEMLAFYLKMLTNLGDRASDRGAYQHLAGLMKKVKQDIENSYAAMDGLAADLMLKYPRRPAMFEELMKVVRRR